MTRRAVGIKILVVFFVVLCGGIAGSAFASSPDYWPTEGWRTSTPEEQGVDSAQLAEAIDLAQKNKTNIHSLLVIRHGYLVMGAYFWPFELGSQHDVASVTKSVTATLVGIAIDQGHIESVGVPVLSFFPDREIANLDARKKAMTLEHLLTMTGGLECVNSPGEVTLFQMMGNPDWIQFMLDLPMADEPGERFVYNSGGVHLLSAIIRESTGMNALAFAQEHLFAPLGISDVAWPLDEQGLDNHGWGDLRLTPHDMAKLGFLYLHDGEWDGKQVLSSEWVTAATQKHTTTDHPLHDGYGYLWWIRDGGFAAVGRGCQRIYVVPEEDLVVVMTAGAGSAGQRTLEELVTETIIPAAIPAEPLEANPAGVKLLAEKIRQAGQHNEKPEPVPRLSRLARRISGKTYALEANQFGLASASLTFAKGSDKAVVRLIGSSGPVGASTVKLTVGLDNVSRITPRAREGLPAAAKGYWRREDVFVIYFDEIANINHWRLTLTFEDDLLTLKMQERSGLGTTIIRGRQSD